MNIEIISSMCFQRDMILDVCPNIPEIINITNTPNIPNIPNIPTISDIPIIIQISSTLWFRKCMTLGVCLCSDILNNPYLPYIPAIP